MTTKALNDKELQAYYDQLFAMYGTSGWARLQEDVERMLASMNSLAGVDSAEALWFKKGQIDNMLWLQSHQTMCETAYNDLIAQQEGGDAAQSTGGKARMVGPEGEVDPLS